VKDRRRHDAATTTITDASDRHPTAVAFLDESGSISQDRFFSVGCLKLSEPSILLRRIQKLRDRHHWYHEVHFFDLTKDALPFYERVVEIVAASGGQFSCFVADREGADPVARFGTPWKAYEKLAAQLLLGSIKRRVVDLLTSAVAFEFRQSTGIAGRETPKARLARKLRNEFGVKTFLQGHEGDGINVKLYGSQSKLRQRRAAKPRGAGPR
jgi:hypothetical protein